LQGKQVRFLCCPATVNSEAVSQSTCESRNGYDE
jgi:hypothetical protein